MAQKPRKKKQTKRNKPKPTNGRPTKYDPAICDRIVALGLVGKSKAQIRREIGIHHSTWGEWAQKYPEFSAAIKESYELSMAWWEDQGMSGMTRGVRFNATAYIFQMKNRFPAEYRDRQELTGKDGGAIQSVVAHTVPDMANVTDPREALKAFETFRMAATGTQH